MEIVCLYAPLTPGKITRHSVAPITINERKRIFLLSDEKVPLDAIIPIPNTRLIFAILLPRTVP